MNETLCLLVKGFLGLLRLLSVFVARAVVGEVGGGFTAMWLLWGRGDEAMPAGRKPSGCAEKALLEQFGVPLTGTQTRHYTNHALSYDQSKQVPRWVFEHVSKSKIMGDADRKHCKFKPDPNIPATFSAFSEDYVGSGWSRGHMAPAGNNKFSSQAMAETFYLSNIVLQNFDNNAEYWNRMEMYLSGLLTLPQTGSHGKKTIRSVILAHRSLVSTEPLALGAFVVPNEALGFQRQLSEFQVSLQDLEKLSGLVFSPHVERASGISNICSVDTCRLLDFQEFTLYLSTRKIEGAQSVPRLEKVLENLKNVGVEPDDYFMSRYKKKLEELKAKEQSWTLERKSS
uniref:Exo/endonuclease G n=1 Tax=Suricata suricatta TaxID=37032 RepID=A0A673VI74_SURSU